MKKETVNKKRKHQKVSAKKCNKRERLDKLEDEVTNQSDSLKGINDPSWYAANPALLRDVASFPFSNVLGLNVDLGRDLATYHLKDTNFRVPGVCGIEVVLCPGVSEEGSSAINVAAKGVFSYVRAANSGRTNYEAADLMQFLLAMDSIYAFYTYMLRIYGCLNLYNQRNRYLPDTLLKAMHVDPVDLRGNRAQFRAYLEMFAQQANVFSVPNIMPLFSRHRWMFEHLYADSPNEMAQIYVFIPRCFWKHVEVTGEAELPYLSPIDLPNNVDNLMSFNKLREIGDEILYALINSEDAGTISGDIRKAYGNNVLKLDPVVPFDYMVLPVYNEEVLSQIENSTSMGYFDIASLSKEQKCIYQRFNIDSTELIFTPYITSYHPGEPCKAILNLHRDHPEPEDVIVASRLMSTASQLYTGTGGAKGQLKTAGTEFVTGYYYWGSNPDNSVHRHQVFTNDHAAVTDGKFNAIDLNKRLIFMNSISAFNRHPLFRLWVYNGTDFSMITQLLDFDNYTLLDQADLDGMHNCAIMSELALPVLGVI